MVKTRPLNLILKSTLSIFILCVLHVSVLAQLQFPEKTELFRDDVVPRIDIQIAQGSLDYILDPSNKESDELFEATFIFANGSVSDTMESIGFRLRGNTSRSAQKKSFKIDLNAFVPGRKYHGVTKINLNGQHNDPTSARAKICADLADWIQIPSMRTNHVELFINNQYYGLYSNVEHIDQNYVKKRFGNKNGNLYKCLYPADLNYKGNNPNSYKEVIYGRRNYELKNNQQTDDYTDFANFIKVLNLTSDANFACELEKVFNVDLYLKTIIFDILTGNWDGPIYNKNNFYLYHNEATDLFEYIPYDLDNTLGIDWLNQDWGNRNIYNWSPSNETRPLYNRIMDTKEYRDRFSFYMEDILLSIYNESELYPYLDELRSKLMPFIESDNYYTLDYGFNIEHFENGFEYELPFFQTDYGIKSFVQTRLITSFTQLVLHDIHPIIRDRRNNHPNENENIEILATIVDDNDDLLVELCYSINDGAEICLPMKDDGTQNDGAASDGLYGIILPPASELGQIQYSIRATDQIDQVSLSPRCGDEIINIEESDLKLAINEIMASNNTIIADEEGEFDDWIELHNYGNVPIYLGDKYLTDNAENKNKWSMPHRTLEGGEYLLFWADDDRNQGSNHTNFKLSKGGEYLGIYDHKSTDYTLIDELDFEGQISDISFGRLPNGTGDFVHLFPSPGTPNLVTGTKENMENESLFYASPNPSDGIVRISGPGKIQSIKLFDAMGKTVDFSSISEDMLVLPNPVGLYFIHFITEKHIPVIIRIIKI